MILVKGSDHGGTAQMLQKLRPHDIGQLIQCKAEDDTPAAHAAKKEVLKPARPNPARPGFGPSSRLSSRARDPKDPSCAPTQDAIPAAHSDRDHSRSPTPPS